MGSTNDQFDRVFSDDPKYLGVMYQSAVAPMKVGEYAVVNTDAENSGGTHWVGLYRKSARKYWYMDSFGILPAQGVAALRKRTVDIVYQDEQLQPLDSDRCGEWVATWLLWVRQGLPFDTFMTAYPNEKAL